MEQPLSDETDAQDITSSDEAAVAPEVPPAAGEKAPVESAGGEAADSKTAETKQDDAAEADAPKPQVKKSIGKKAADYEIEEEEVQQATGVKEWYILKVQSNREDSIRDTLARRVKIEALDDFFGEILVPIEKVSEFKNGKKRTVKRKLWPGYIVVYMEINDFTWHLVRGTPGIGDFVGAAGKPTALSPEDIAKIKTTTEVPEEGEAPKLKINLEKDDRVKIVGGTFENFEGAVESVDMANGRVTVMISIFARTTPVELDYWEVEKL